MERHRTARYIRRRWDRQLMVPQLGLYSAAVLDSSGRHLLSAFLDLPNAPAPCQRQASWQQAARASVERLTGRRRCCFERGLRLYASETSASSRLPSWYWLKAAPFLLPAMTRRVRGLQRTRSGADGAPAAMLQSSLGRMRRTYWPGPCAYRPHNSSWRRRGRRCRRRPAR